MDRLSTGPNGDFYTLFDFSPARLAAASCRLSDETNRSACHSSAQAMCSASNVRTRLVSSIVTDEPMTEGVRSMMSASRTSATRRCFARSSRVLPIQPGQPRLSLPRTQGPNVNDAPVRPAKPSFDDCKTRSLYYTFRYKCITGGIHAKSNCIVERLDRDPGRP